MLHRQLPYPDALLVKDKERRLPGELARLQREANFGCGFVRGCTAYPTGLRPRSRPLDKGVRRQLVTYTSNNVTVFAKPLSWLTTLTSNPSRPRLLWGRVQGVGPDRCHKDGQDPSGDAYELVIEKAGEQNW